MESFQHVCSRFNPNAYYSMSSVYPQVVNGLMEREDWEKAIQTPLGVLPGGSGNALAASIHYYTG